MTCMNCGTQLPDNAAFCNVCGAKQNPNPVQPMESQMNVVPQPMVEEDVKTMPLQPEMPMAAEAPVAAPMPVAAEQPEAPVAEQPMAQPEIPEATEQPVVQPDMSIMAEQPVMQEQPIQYQNPYANGQPMQYQNAQPMNGVPYQNMQPMNNGMQYQNPYQNVQPMNGGAYPNQQGYNPYAYQNAQPVKNKKTGIIIGLILAAIVIVAIILIFVVFKKDGHKSYRAAIDAFMEAMDDHDLDGMLATYPEPVRADMREELLGYYADEAQLWAMYDMMVKEECGSGAKMSYSIDDIEPYEEYELIELEEDFRMYYDYKCNITEAYEIEVEQVYRGSAGEYNEWYDFLAMEIDGKWYIIMD